MSEQASTGLTVYQKVNDPLAFVVQVGTAIAKSRMFGCDNEHQGQVFALQCLAEQMAPLSLQQKYHIIEGNLSMKSERMLAELRERGGNYKIISRTPDRAAIEVEFLGQSYLESFTWEEAQLERFPYKKDGKALKANWSTPRGKKQMLWARVVSDAVGTIAPEIRAGVYTPEEIVDFDHESTAKVVNAAELMKKTAEKVRKSDYSAVTTVKQGEVEDAEFEVKEGKQSEDKQPEEGDSSSKQRQRIGELFQALGATDEQIKKALAKRGCNAFRQLTHEQADGLIDLLKNRLEASNEKLAGDSHQEPDATEQSISQPVGQTIIDEIKSLMKGQPDIVKQVREHIHRHGIDKLADLSHADANVLLAALQMKNIELFIDHSLIKAEVPRDIQEESPPFD